MNWNDYAQCHRLADTCAAHGVTLFPKDGWINLRLDSSRYPLFAADNSIAAFRTVEEVEAYVNGMFSPWRDGLRKEAKG